MPVPRPAQDEDKNKFMSRCVGFMHGENDKKDDKDKWTQEQMTAICFSQWERKNKQQKSELSNEERESEEEFTRRFLLKYPQYTTYFENESIEETTE